MPNSFVFDQTPNLDAITAAVAANDALLDLIRGTDVVNIQTNIDANETKIDTIIAAIPQEVRGTLTAVGHQNDTINYLDILNLTSSQGKLINVVSYVASPATSGQIIIYIDGIESTELTITDLNVPVSIILKGHHAVAQVLLLDNTDTTNFFFNLEFASSLRIKHKITGTPGAIVTRVLYNIDSF